MTGFRELNFLETPSGRVPFYEWYDSLKDRQTKRIIAGKLRQLQNIKFKNYKSVGGGVFELRIFYGPGYRIYFGFEHEKIIVAICGGDKKSQAKDIDQAICFWKEYKSAS